MILTLAVSLFLSDTKLRFHEGICKYVLEIMEAYTVTKERNLTENRRDLLGSSSDDLVFDPKFFKANKEVTRALLVALSSLTVLSHFWVVKK